MSILDTIINTLVVYQWWIAAAALVAIVAVIFWPRKNQKLAPAHSTSTASSTRPSHDTGYLWFSWLFIAIVGGVLFWYFPKTTVTILGTLTGLFIIVALIGLAAPLYIGMGLLVNKPNQDEKKNSPSEFHLFTFIETGQVKIVVRGETVVRMIMDTAGKRFAAGIQVNPQLPEYWEVIDATNHDDEDPIKRVFWLLRPWAWYVFRTTGAIFTGVYPFQKVREYPLERTKLSRDEKEGNEKSNLVLAVKEDYSDHLRIRQFLYPMHITGAETRDKIPLNIIGTAKLRVTNPHKATFSTDRWDHLLVNLITDAINTITKALSIDEVLTFDPEKNAKAGEEDAKKLRKPINEAVLTIKHDTVEYGVQIDGFDVSEINPDLPSDELAQLRAQAIATQNAKATTIDGKARAQVLRDMNEANAAGGDSAIASLQTEGLVRAAEAASKGSGTVILMPGGGASTDPTLTAILAELKRRHQGGA